MIEGKRAVHFGDDQTTEFTATDACANRSRKPAFRITAAHGKLSGDRKDVVFTGSVRAFGMRDPRPGKARPDRSP